MRVNPHRKRSTVISPRATVVEGPTPVQVSKRPRVLNTEEERLTGRAEVEGAVITVTNPTQEEIPAGTSLVTDLGSVKGLSGSVTVLHPRVETGVESLETGSCG